MQLLNQTNDTTPQVAFIPEGDNIASVIRLQGYDDMYLYVAQLLDPRVVQQLQNTQESVIEYANLENRRLTTSRIEAKSSTPSTPRILNRL